MCGIIACRTHAPAIDYLLSGLRRLEYRGYDSAGVAVRTTTGDVARFRTVGQVDALNRSVAGWTGALCEVPVCDPTCTNADCVAPDVCKCWEGYIGQDCIEEDITSDACSPPCDTEHVCLDLGSGPFCYEENYECFGIDASDASACGTNGDCLAPDVCECAGGYVFNPVTHVCDLIPPDCGAGCQNVASARGIAPKRRMRSATAARPATSAWNIGPPR